MEPELVNLLRGMAPAAARVSSHSRALRGAAAGAAEGSAAAGTGRWGWQQQQQQQSEALSEDERLLQEMLGGQGAVCRLCAALHVLVLQASASGAENVGADELCLLGNAGWASF